MGKPCPDCGGHRWAFNGYCLEIACAGHYSDKNYPRSRTVTKNLSDSSAKPVEYKEAKPPRSSTARREAERYYEIQGKKAPWL